MLAPGIVAPVGSWTMPEIWTVETACVKPVAASSSASRKRFQRKSQLYSVEIPIDCGHVVAYAPRHHFGGRQKAHSKIEPLDLAGEIVAIAAFKGFQGGRGDRLL